MIASLLSSGFGSEKVKSYPVPDLVAGSLMSNIK